MTKKEIAAVAAEFGMTSDPFSRNPGTYFKRGSLAVDVDFGLCGGEIYFGLIFESEFMADHNVEISRDPDTVTTDEARAILRRLFTKAHFNMDLAVACTEAECAFA